MSASAGAIRAGRAFVELFAEDSELTRTLKTAQMRIQSFGQSVGRIGAVTFGLGASMVGALAPTITAASDFEETFSKFNTVFGDNAAAVQEWGNVFGKQIGRSKTQVLSFLASTQDLLVPLGFEPGAATEMSKQLTQLAVDLGSFNNMADEDVLRDLHAALTGSGEVMKKYGVLVSEAAVKQELLNQGMDPKEVTDQQKVMARLSIIMRGTTAAQGDALRTADSFANSMKRLRAQISDVAVQIGQALLPVITPLVKHAGEFVEFTLVPWIERNKELIPTLLKAGATIAATGAGLIVFGKIVTGTSALIGTFSAAMKVLQTGSIAAKAGVAGLAVAGILALATAIYKVMPSIRDFNKQLAIGSKLSGQLNDREQRRQQNFLADVGVLGSSDEKRAAIATEAEMAAKNIAGLEQRAKAAQKEVDRLNTTFKSATGNKLLEAAQKELEEVQQRVESARNWALDLDDALKAVDREEQLTGSLPAAPDLQQMTDQLAGQASGVDGLAAAALPPSLSPSAIAASAAAGGSDIAERLSELTTAVTRIERAIETGLQFS